MDYIHVGVASLSTTTTLHPFKCALSQTNISETTTSSHLLKEMPI